MNPLIELLLGFGGVVLMLLAAVGMVWTLVEVVTLLLKIVI